MFTFPPRLSLFRKLYVIADQNSAASSQFKFEHVLIYSPARRDAPRRVATSSVAFPVRKLLSGAARRGTPCFLLKVVMTGLKFSCLMLLVQRPIQVSTRFSARASRRATTRQLSPDSCAPLSNVRADKFKQAFFFKGSFFPCARARHGSPTCSPLSEGEPDGRREGLAKALESSK